MCHTFGVAGSPAIPADFFVSGSLPFSGDVCLKGEPLGPTSWREFGQADTLIARTENPFDRCNLPSAAESTVAIEIVALSLVSVGPITVNEGGTLEAWDVAVDLSEVVPPAGSLTAVKSHCSGGTYTSMLNVQPRFTFTKVADTAEVRVLDTGVEAIDPVLLVQDTAAPWVTDVDPNLGVALDACSDFHHGVEEPAPLAVCDCDGDGVHDICQSDCDFDGVIDACDPNDADGDGVPDGCDNCPNDPNATITNIDTSVTYTTLQDAISAGTDGQRVPPISWGDGRLVVTDDHPIVEYPNYLAEQVKAVGYTDELPDP